MLILVAQAKALQLGTVAEWFAAIGTVAAVIVALLVAFQETKRTNKRERLAQAEKVAAWKFVTGSQKDRTIVRISNASTLPIYDVLLSYGVSYGAGAPYSKGNDSQVFIVKVPPGLYSVAGVPKNSGGAMHLQLGLSISFRDTNGRFWRRDATGRLTETKRHPFKEMSIEEPISGWSPIRPHPADHL